MMAEKNYTVARAHIGDRDYAVGDTRTANDGEVAHLVANGVLVEVKAERAPESKRAPKEPAQK